MVTSAAMRNFKFLLLASCAMWLPACGDAAVVPDLPVVDMAMPDLTPPVDLAKPDFAGIACGSSTCGTTQDCCLQIVGGTAQAMCMPAGSCPDGGAALMCDGPEDCSSSTPECCVTLDITFSTTDGGPPPTGTGDSSCVNKCVATASFGGGMATVHTRLCHTRDDCTGLQGSAAGFMTAFSECCQAMQAGATTFCAPAPVGPLVGTYTC